VRPAWAGALLVLLLAAGQTVAAELTVNSGPGRIAALTWDQLRLQVQPRVGGGLSWELNMSNDDPLAVAWPGELRLRCQDDAGAGFPSCRQGTVSVRWAQAPVAVAANFVLLRVGRIWRLELNRDALKLIVELDPVRPSSARAQLVLKALGLDDLGEFTAQLSGLERLSGSLSGHLQLVDGRLDGAFEWRNGALDALDGRLAAEGVELSVALDADLAATAKQMTVEVLLSQGEWLFDAVYLPPPEHALRLKTRWRWPLDDRLVLDAFELDDPGALLVRGSAGWVKDAEQWRLDDWIIDQARLELPAGWRRWVDGAAAALGFAEIDGSGAAELRAGWRSGEDSRGRLRLDGVDLVDPQQRLTVRAVSGDWQWEERRAGGDLQFAGIDFYGLSFGPARMHWFSPEPDRLALRRGLRLPLLDGAVVVDRFELDRRDESGTMNLDVSLEPLDLAALTTQLGLLPLGGTLSASFPDVRWHDNRLSFNGAINIQAFSGQILIDSLAIERPLGPLPALSAQATVSRLDLLALTGAINFGRMEGQLSGRVNDLRLLNWRPVAMDARLFTELDAPRRRISQRAVDHISRLGTGGGALLGQTALGLFKDFPYRRVGLSCRLSNNVCQMDGVAPHESGGFYIVEGRSLPRLDIIGHRRRVDWPHLVDQLIAITN